MKKLPHMVFALVLLPACFGALQTLWVLAHRFQRFSEGSFYFFLGISLYLAFQWVFFTPIRTYIFGHELTHALAAWMSGGEVQRFHVSKKGGHVVVTKTNLFVALAPYMIPVYALALLGTFSIANACYDLSSWWRPFLCVLGASVGFHAALTVYALRQDQPDLKLGGKFLSGVLIFLGNALLFGLLLGFLFPHTVSMVDTAHRFAEATLQDFRVVGRGATYLWDHLKPPKPFYGYFL